MQQCYLAGLRPAGSDTRPGDGPSPHGWALIVVLAYSRHSFVWRTFSQKLEDVIAGLEAAWAPGGPDVETAVRTRPNMSKRLGSNSHHY